MTLINYSWFELELNYGLFFYPNWELNYFYNNSVMPFMSFMSNLAFFTENNTRIYTYFKSFYDVMDFLFIYLYLDVDVTEYINYSLLLDIYIFLSIFNFNFSTKFIYNGVDCLWLFLYNDSSFIYILNEAFYADFINNVLMTNYYMVYNSFITSSISLLLNIIWYFVIGFIGIVIYVTATDLLESNLKFNNNLVLSRFILYFNNLSKELRINFEFLIQFGLFIIYIWLFNLMSFDDLNIEFIELFHLFIFYYFLFIIFYLLFRYSFHYFAFLEASVTEGKSSLFISKQFVRDISNTFALFLRFFLLLFRLNIYDGLDDFLDSYCLFFYDFDEDINTNNIIDTSKLDFTLDNNSDLDISDKETYIWFIEDLFKTYLLYFFEFLYFIIFILEELFRLSLAFYITYLIIFEVHTVNGSYYEDNYFITKKLNKDQTL